MLSVFHKLETSKKTRKLQNLPLLKRTEVYWLCVIYSSSHSPSVYATMHAIITFIGMYMYVHVCR